MEESVRCRMLRRTLNLALKHNEKLDKPKNRTNVLKEQLMETNETRVEPAIQWEPIEGFWAEVLDNHTSSSDEEEEMLCNCRGRGRKTNILPRFPRETSACKADFVSASYGKGRASIIRDNLLLTKEKAPVGLPKNHQVIMDKPVPVFSKTEKKHSESWNDEDFPALGSAAVKGNESAVLSRGKPMNSSNQSIKDTHRVNNAPAVFSDSVSFRPDTTKSIEVTSKTSQVPARVKDSLKSLNQSTLAWYEDMITTSQNNSAFQLPKDSDMFHKETTYLSGAKTSYDEGLMNRYLRNSLDSSIGSHFISRSVAGSILVQNELPHLQSDDQLSSNVCQSSSFGDNTDVYTHLDMARNNNDLKDNIIANSNNDQCITNQFSSEGEKSDIMRKHIDYSLVTNYKQSDVNVKKSNIKGENTDKSDVNNGSLERKKYEKKIIPESNSSDRHKWKVKGEFVIQVDGLPPNHDLSGLVDLVASFGTVSDQEVLKDSTSFSARFKFDNVDSCDFAVESLHGSDCLYAGILNVLIFGQIITRL